MAHTMHPLLADTRLNLARHEAGHFWLAHLLGFEAHDIALGADGGRCSVTYPMVPASFAAEYARSPLQAARWLMGILAVIRAGTYVEVHSGQYGAELRGRDLADTEAWRAAILPLYGADGWTKVYASMYRSMQRWYRYPQVQAVIREMAVPIALQDYISRYQMLSLLEVSGAGLAPDPCFDTILAPARRSSSPSSHQPPAAAGRGSQGASDTDLVYTDARHPLIPMESQGGIALFKRIIKGAGVTRFIVTRDKPGNHAGQLDVDSWEYGSETEARQHMARLLA